MADIKVKVNQPTRVGQQNATKVVSAFSGDSSSTVSALGDVVTYNDGQTPPTDAEIETEMDRLEAEWNSQEYARKREAEYPSIAELTVALYDTDDKAAIDAKRAAVKAKYPKPS